MRWHILVGTFFLKALPERTGFIWEQIRKEPCLRKIVVYDRQAKTQRQEVKTDTFQNQSKQNEG